MITANDKHIIHEAIVQRTIQQLNGLKTQSNFRQERDTILEHLIQDFSLIKN